MDSVATHRTLRGMVLALEKIDASLHSEGDIAPPTVVELRLYNLILAHVKSYIFLFQREGLCSCTGDLNFSHCSGDSCDLRELVEEWNVRRWVHDDLLFDTWFLSGAVIELLKEDKTFIPKVNVSLEQTADATQGKGSQDLELIIKMMRKTRENHLHDILLKLEEMGRSRLYAPPNDWQIHYYREMRKWITSCLAYIDSKVTWQKDWKGAECNYQSENSGWISLPCRYDDLPKGHSLPIAFDLISEFQSLTKRCMRRLSDVLCSTSKKKKIYMKGVKRLGAPLVQHSTSKKNKIYMKGAKRLGAPLVQHRQEKKTKMTTKIKYPISGSGSALLVTSQIGKSLAENDGGTKKTRLQHLHDILQAFHDMALLSFYTRPTIREVRLYVQIVEHVNSSLWLFKTAGNAFPLSTQYLKGSTKNLAVEAKEMMTREEYLQGIVSSLDAVKSLSLATIPSVQEVACYKEIFTFLNLDFMCWSGSLEREAKIHVKGQVTVKRNSPNSNEDVVAIKDQLMFAYSREAKFFEEVNEESMKMLSMFFPSIPLPANASDAFRWIEENKDQLKIQVTKLFSNSLEGIEILDKVMLVLEEMSSLNASIFERLSDAHGRLDSGLHYGDGLYDIVAREIRAAYIVLPWSPLYASAKI